MKIFLLCLTLLSASVLAKEPKKQTRWERLMHLVHQEMKILSSAKRKGPELQYRMLELHSEKLKLIHEKDNNTMMEKSKTSSVASIKESFFKETRAYYQITKDFGSKLMKDYPQTNRRAEVLYALALNSRDFGTDNITERYLLETISLVKDPHHSLRHHAETALADFYYNEKRFPEAVSYYERVIKVTEDEWLTKHYFNLSWCYLKVREFDKAIATITESYFLSRNKAYVSVKDQALENIGSFYVYSDRTLDGLNFYLKNEPDSVPYLMPMAQRASEKGQQKEAEEILDSAQKLVDKNNWFQYQEQLFHSYLDFYRHYNRFDDHEATSRKLVAYYKKAESEQGKELKLKVEMKDEAIEKMRTLAGFLQIKLAKDMKENDGGQYKEKELDVVLSFFEHLIFLDKTRKVEYLYFRGETYYSVRRAGDAAPAYVEAVQEAKLVKNNDYARKSLNSLLALTGQEVLGKDLNKKYLIFTYSEHITLWPRDAMSEQIYPKLFNIYYTDQQDPKATGVLRAYNKAYPEHLKEQQVLMTKVLDQFIEKKETVKLSHWIQEFRAGFLSYSKETILKTEIVLGNILFLQYQDIAKTGNKLAAAKGFESIYVHKLYSDKVKFEAAFFAALTYLEMGETEKSYYWQALAYGRMTEEEKFSKRDEQLKMSERTYKLQDFVTSYKMSEFLLKKFCALKDDTQNRFFEIAIMTALVEDNTANAEEVVRKHSGCLKKPENAQVALSQIYQVLEKKGDFFGLRGFVKRHSTNEFNNRYRFTLQKWFWEKSSAQLKEQIRQEFKALAHPETIAWLKEMDQYELAKKKMDEIEQEVIWDKPIFNGEVFNKSLEAHLLKVQNFKNNFQHLTQSTQVDLAILSTRMFAQVYQDLGQRVMYLHPKGMAPDVMKDFSKAMKQVGDQFVTVSKQFNKQLSKAIKEKETLAWGSRSIASVEEIENPIFSFFTGLTMDKAKD